LETLPGVLQVADVSETEDLVVGMLFRVTVKGSAELPQRLRKNNFQFSALYPLGWIV
jgi:hypothetical protein